MFIKNQYIKITDSSLFKTSLSGAFGIIVDESGPFLKVFVTTGEYMGKILNLYSNQLSLRN